MGLVLAEYIYGKEEKSTFGNNLAMKKESFWIHGNLCLSSVLMTFKIILIDYHFVVKGNWLIRWRFIGSVNSLVDLMSNCRTSNIWQVFNTQSVDKVLKVLSTVDGKAAKQYCALLSQLEGQRLFVGSSPFKHFFLA